MSNYDSFELLYLYVENVRCFESQGFSFTAEYNISYDKDKRTLSIEVNHDNDHLKGFFGPNISNINVIVGKNGSGKTTVLELLGLSSNHRKTILQNNEPFSFSVFKTNTNQIYIEGNCDCIKKINKEIEIKFDEKSKDYSNLIFEIQGKDVLKYNIPHEYSLESFTINFTENKHNSNDKQSTIIVFNKSLSNPPIFRLTPMIERIYIGDFKKTYYSLLYDLFSSSPQLEFVKLLITTNVELKFNFFFESYEEKVIQLYINHFIKSCNNVIYNEENNILISYMSTSFMWKIFKVFSNISEDIVSYLVKSLRIFDEMNLKKSKYEKCLDKVNKVFGEIYNQINNFDKCLDKYKENFDTLKKEVSNSRSSLEQISNDLTIVLKDNESNHISLSEISVNVNYIKKIIDKLYSIINFEINNFPDLLALIKKSLEEYENYTDYSKFIESYDNLLKHTIFLTGDILCQINNSESEMIVKCDCNYDESIFRFLKAVDEINSIFIYEINPLRKKALFEMEYGHNISSGELQLLIEISNLYNTFKMIKNKHIIFLLDEPDKTMHPEWSSKYINCLITMINDLSKREFKDGQRKFQFIITTHSPFMLSDVPKEFVTCIEIDKNHKRVISKPKKSFASNYYDIIKDSFFLENFIGDFAKEKINEMIKNINSLETVNDCKCVDSLRNKIKIIDDDFLKGILNKKLEDKIASIDKNYNLEIRKLNLKEEISRKIEELNKIENELAEATQKPGENND